MLAAPTSTLSVTTEPLPAGALIPLADPRRPLVWLRNGEGIVGIGEAARLEFRGPDRFRDARDAWADLAGRAQVEDRVRQRGTGLVAFGTFAFAAGSERVSTLIVPRAIVGRRGSTGWITRVTGGATTTASAPGPIGESGYGAAFVEGRMSPGAYRAAVDEALRRIDTGELGKVVLSRDVSARLAPEADLRLALERFAEYADCWAFAVDGLMGASPETLVTVRGGRLGARVLAGSTARGVDEKSDAAQANALLVSAKDLDEHDYAVVSVLAALAPFARDVWSSPAPFPLMLPNVWHLASDVDGRLAEDTGTLDLLEALHPTAAVAGSPTPEALELIGSLEPFDRGRYAGPVGWVDASGDGEWAVALRCAQVGDDGRVTAYAGAGIVAGSDPTQELDETTLKLRPVLDAFR